MQLNRRQFIKNIGLFSLSTLAMPSVAKAQKPTEVFEASKLLMGTIVNIKAVHYQGDFVQECFAKAFKIMEKTESILTRHNGSSALGQLNGKKTLLNAPIDLLNVASQAQKIEHFTGGAFNPSVLSVLEYLETQKNISKKEIIELHKLVQNNSLRINSKQISLASNELKITLDGIAKGYIVDKACQALDQAGLTDYLVNAGGDIRAKGFKDQGLLNHKKWTVAIEDPYKSRNYPTSIALNNMALATSGNYEKKFSHNYNHLINPNYQQNNNEQILSVSVLAPTAMLADSLATAFSCMPVQNTIKLVNTLPSVDCFILTKDQTIKSNNWA